VELRPEWLKARVHDLRWPAILGGTVQMFACMGAIMLGYKPFVMSQFAAIDPRAVTAGVESSGETAVMGLGLVIAVAYILRPLTVTLVYFFFEGAIRAIAAFVSNEIVGTLPLYVVMLISKKVSKDVREYQLGSRICDTVVAPPKGEQGYDLEIASCRPKDWNPSLTISYGDHLYELAESLKSEAPRPFVYRLKKAPVSKVVRGLHLYSPEEVVEKPVVEARFLAERRLVPSR
jgi:hypothetical protein